MQDEAGLNTAVLTLVKENVAPVNTDSVFYMISHVCK